MPEETPKWQPLVNRLCSADIPPEVGVSIALLFQEFVNSHETLRGSIVSNGEVALMRMARKDNAPDWLDALVDLLFEVDLDYSDAQEVIGVLVDHWIKVWSREAGSHSYSQ